ncbi:MAG: winged helix-turn-helix transcriptional regulator [Spirochaetales bacterium]|nr:winged helix-turn-helix transcriptional regulator [Spirochaetales bacterium]
MGFYEETGILILGTRLKRLSERFLSEVGKMYEKLDIGFEPAWFPLFFLLHKKGSLSVTEIADELNVSQPGASQIVSLLCRKGLISMEADSYDRRRKIVSFTAEGESLLALLLPVWKTLEASMLELFQNEKEGFDAVKSFNELEQILNRISLGDSVSDKLKK